jgi:quinohemoprotein ethanol dehydrogenase
VVSRGLAVWNGRVYAASLDGRLFALDAGSGKIIWQVDTLIDRNRDYTITGAPQIASKNVVIGNSGAEYGVRGYITAYDLETGTQSWRFYTVPGDPAKPFEHAEMEIAAATWDPNSRWDVGGGGTVWDAMVWDPELNLLYIGTGNGAPWAQSVRSPAGGDNLFLASILALDPDTGRLVWHYQTVPGENWDYTATQHMILADLSVGGKQRRVLMQAPKNGFFYVLDRTNGQLLSAEKFTTVTWADHIDLDTGRPVITGAGSYDAQAREVAPGPGGGHNWQPMSFNPDTGLVYFTYFDDPAVYSLRENYQFVPGWNNQAVSILSAGLGEQIPQDATSGSKRGGYLGAWDPVRKKYAWNIKLGDGIFHGGVLSTAGGLVFEAKDDGNFIAYDAATGAVLHEIQTGNSIIAAPATYQVDGEQYVVVMAGWGGGLLGYYPPGSAVAKYRNDGRVLAFKLGGGDVPLPPKVEALRPIPVPPVIEASGETIRAGARIFQKACGECHYNIYGGYPDLRRMSPATHALFNDIVLHGIYQSKGMGGFADTLTEEDAEAIHIYLIDLANQALREQEAERRKVSK